MIEADTDQNGQISLAEFNSIFKKFLERPSTTAVADDEKDLNLEVVEEVEENQVQKSEVVEVVAA